MTQPTPAEQPARHTVDTITSDALDALYDELDALKSIGRTYCPACGRGDCSPTADQWYEQQQRAQQAEAERDSWKRWTKEAEAALTEARMWARHGYEIGQRSCTWTDHGVAPAWLTEPAESAALDEHQEQQP